jgi:hypothetical protein
MESTVEERSNGGNVGIETFWSDGATIVAVFVPDHHMIRVDGNPAFTSSVA